MFQTNKLSSSQNEDKTQNLTKDYVRTSDQQKLQLIDLVINEKYSMKLASQIVGVKLSTVKYIVKAYKTDKQYFMDKLKPKKIRFQKEKKKLESKNQSLTKFDSGPKNQELKRESPIEENELKSSFEINNQLSLLCMQNFSHFQNYCQLTQYWNPYFLSNNWIFNFSQN